MIISAAPQQQQQRQLVLVVVALLAWSRPVPGADPQPAAQHPPLLSPYSFFVLGDWGSGDVRQLAVAQAMEEVGRQLSARDCPPRFVLSVGDQVYPRGLAAASAEQQWDSVFRHPYQRLALPFYGVLGNHDALGDPGLLRTPSISASENIRLPALSAPKWLFPSPAPYFYYATNPAPGARLLVIDTCLLGCVREPPARRNKLQQCQHFLERVYGSFARAQQLADEHEAWLAKELRAAARDPSVAHVWVAGHVPAYSTLMYGDAWGLKFLFRLMAANNASVYFSGWEWARGYVFSDGHAHTLQHLSKQAAHNRTWHQVVSGGGGSYLLPGQPHHKPHFETRFAVVDYGFAVVRVTGRHAELDMVCVRPRPGGAAPDMEICHSEPLY